MVGEFHIKRRSPRILFGLSVAYLAWVIYRARTGTYFTTGPAGFTLHLDSLGELVFVPFALRSAFRWGRSLAFEPAPIIRIDDRGMATRGFSGQFPTTIEWSELEGYAFDQGHFCFYLKSPAVDPGAASIPLLKRLIGELGTPYFFHGSAIAEGPQAFEAALSPYLPRLERKTR